MKVDEALMTEKNLISLEPLFGKVPQLPADFIERSHYLDSLKELSKSEDVVVLVDGEQGAGCTTLLSHFCRSNPRSTLSLFIRPTTKLSYSVDYLRQLLGEQLWEFVTGQPSPSELIDEGQFRRLILSARKRIKKNKLFIIVDGLHQIPQEDHRQIDSIINELLPIDVDQFAIIISGPEDLYRRKINSIRPKVFALPKFSDYEVDQYLEALMLSREDSENIKKLCRGVPGNLAAVKRLLSSGHALNSILEADVEKHLDFLKLEFSSLKCLGQQAKLALAILAFSRHEMTLDTLARVSKLSPIEDFREIFGNLTFIELDVISGVISFASDAHRRIAEGLLIDLRREAIDLQIENLASDPSSAAALQFLPTYYRLTDRQQNLVDCLSADHYVGLLETTRSISALRARAALGARTALELRHVVDVFRFTMQRSTFGALSATEEFQSEVGALAALGLNDKALEVATKAASNEARVALLAEYCRRVRERDGTVESQVVEYIQQLAPQIDFSELGDAAIAIAENLLFVVPDLALKIVDDALTGSSGKEKKRNEVLARMSMSANMSSIEESTVSEKASSGISDESLQKLMSSLRAALKDSSFKEILSLSAGMEIKLRLKFLRWIVGTSRNSERVSEVIGYALDQLVSHAEYVPKAIDLADLAIPLPEISDLAVRESLARRIEGQIPLIEKSAPSKDLILLQVRLAHAEVQIDPVRARARLNEAYYELDQVGSIETKIDCLAIMLSSISEIDVNEEIERAEGFRQVFRQELLENVNALVKNGANQLQALRKAIRSISIASFEDALDVARRLNNAFTRDEARIEAIRTACNSKWSKLLQDAILSALSEITDRTKKDQAMLSAVRAAASASEPQDWLIFVDILAKSCFDPVFTCAISIEQIDIIGRSEGNRSHDMPLERFELALEKIGSTFLQVELRYEVISVLAKMDFAKSELIYEDALVRRQSATLANRSLADVITHCLALVARSFRPLIKYNCLSDEDFSSFVELVDEIPCPTTRVNIYANVASTFWCERKTDRCRHLVREKIRPLLNQSADLSQAEHASQLTLAFPALYVAHAATAIHDLSKISDYQATSAIHSTGRMILRRLSPGEPAAGIEDAVIVPDYEDMVDLIGLLKNAREDWSIYHLIKAASVAISSKEHRNKLTGQQRGDLFLKFKALAEEKLPDKINISHEGYLVTCTANIMRISEAKNHEWEALFVRAHAIENSADRIYVLLELSDCLPARMLEPRRALIAEARSLIEQLPSSHDKYSRLEQYIKSVREVAPALAKSAFRDALSITLDSGHRDIATRWRRNLVDLADSVSTDLSALVSEMSDEDPARAEAKAEIYRGIEVQKLRRRISEGDEDKVLTAPQHNLSAAAEKNLISLINGRMEPRDVESLLPYLNAAGSMYLTDSYTILSWYIENAIRRCVTSAEVAAKITPLSEVILLSSKIALMIAGKLSASPKRIPMPVNREDISGALIIRPGERQDALLYLRTWLKVNCSEHIILCDPYYGKNEHEFLRLILSECPEAAVTVITSQKYVIEKGGLDADAFLAEWKNASDDEPPATEILAVGGYSNKSDVIIHDRWLVSGKHALRMGTSFNSIGINKLSELSPLLPDEAERIGVELERYRRRERVIDNVRIGYRSITF
ncbi:hypothetical protein [Xanthomonas arboricola]|uniref:hypothetical protein n=1 Tax=Xanthomonas arboricola TaxID=56448 RepID=UPI0015CE3C17